MAARPTAKSLNLYLYIYILGMPSPAPEQCGGSISVSACNVKVLGEHTDSVN